jgi:hypothetical protein
MTNLNCEYCNIIKRNNRSLSSHRRLCKLNPNRHISSLVKYNEENEIWNKGLTKETNSSLMNASITLINKYKEEGHTSIGKTHSQETKDKISKTRLEIGFPPNKIISSHKKGYYKNFWCDSSWELAYLIYCLDNDILIKRNSEGFYYQYNDDKIRRYYPDFIVGDTYIEIKGCDNEMNKYKYLYFPKKLEVISSKEISKYLSYVESKYGKDFIRLYNNNK